MLPPHPGPLPYHRAIVEHLQVEEPGLWEWFFSTRKSAEAAESVRLELLKTTYRLEPQSQPNLYELANSICGDMGLTCGVTLYQAQTGNALNAALAYLQGEVHVILAGPLLSVLSEKEVQVVLAHELAHFLLFEDAQGVYLNAADLLRGLSADPIVGAAASESARLYNLWTEIYADRWAYYVSADVTATIGALLKVHTGLSELSVESYLRQADEIFSKSTVQSDHCSHPEPYIRARALALWSELGDDACAQIARMIEGSLDLQRLDLLGQKRVRHLTQSFLQTLLTPTWYRTEPVLAHARRFFADFETLAEPMAVDRIRLELDRSNASICDYFCYLLLDFVTVDRDLGDVALAAAVVLARRLGIDKRFAELTQKELTIGKKVLAKIDETAETILANTETVHLS